MTPPEIKERTCNIENADREPCGRILFEGDTSVNYHPGIKRPMEDDTPVCLMHSISDRKRSDEMQAVFKTEIDAILAGQKSILGAKHNPLCGDCTGFKFLDELWLDGNEYTIPVVFTRCFFESEVNVRECTFEKDVRFNGSVFKNTVWFWSPEFNGEADFGSCTFDSDSHFRNVMFKGQLLFLGSNIQSIDFRGCEFHHYARFEGAHFRNIAEFNDVQFLRPADFTFSQFQTPERVHFVRNNQKASTGLRLRLLHCDVEGVNFRDVRWHRRWGRLVLQNELDLLERAKKGSYELVAVLYRQLLKNFEETRSYDLAEECFRGEMVMKQRDHRQSRFSRTMVWLYGQLSSYGSSYTRALSWLAIFIVSFGIALPFSGLRMGISQPSTSGTTIGVNLGKDVFRWPNPHNTRDFLRTAAAGFWASLGIATFQKAPAYEPGRPIGKHLAMLETVVISAQAALFLFALKRRFRR